MKCVTCGGYVQAGTAKKRWLQIFVLLFDINLPLIALKFGVEDSILPAVRRVFLTALGLSAGIFGLAFMLSLLAKPENQVRTCAIIAVVFVGLMVLVDLGIVR